MSTVKYNTGKMLDTAKCIENSLANFKKSRKEIDKMIEGTRRHTDDPQVECYIKKYHDTKKELEVLEKQLEIYSHLLQSAAKKVYTTVDKIDI